MIETRSYPRMRVLVAAQVQPFESDTDTIAAPAQSALDVQGGGGRGGQSRRGEDREATCERRPGRREEVHVRDTLLQGGGDLLGLEGEGASSGDSSGVEDDARYVLPC